jgi:hypothetical protein
MPIRLGERSASWNTELVCPQRRTHKIEHFSALPAHGHETAS